MASGCPVCEQPLPAMAPGCPSCGYPTALALDALRALGDGEPAAPPSLAPARAPPAKRRRPATPPPDAQAELCQRIASDTDAQLGVLQELGGDTQDVGSDLRQAALAQVEGRTTEALDILRRALGRVQDQSSRLFDQRVRELAERDASLRRSGVGTNADADLARMRGLFTADRRLEAIALLRETDQRTSRIEGDWKGLQGLLRQIETLRTAIHDAGEEAGDVESDIQAVRQLLAGPGVTIEGLDQASQIAAKSVMRLNEALPAALSAELDRHDRALAELPEEHPPVRSARQIHTDAVRHLRRGRLPEASESLRQLRAALTELRRAPVKAPEPPAPIRGAPPTAPGGSAPVAPPPPESLARLLDKARGLAARVRSLPAESEIAFEAASEIRLATELLRARKLDEAEGTLTRLMRTLDAEGAGER